MGRMPITGRTRRTRTSGRGSVLVKTYSIRSSLASFSGSVDSFHVLVRWKDDPVVEQDLPQTLAPHLHHPGR